MAYKILAARRGKIFSNEQQSRDVLQSQRGKINKIYDVVISHKYKFICLNDNEKIEDFDTVRGQIADMFERILPEKSGFER